MKIVENYDYIKVLPDVDYADETTLYDPSRLHSGSINLVQQVDIRGHKTLIDSHVRIHSKKSDTFEVHDLADGLYEIISLVVPTRDALENLGMVNGFVDKDYQREWIMLNPKNLFKPETRIIVAVDEDSPTNFSYLVGKCVNGATVYYWQPIMNLQDLIDELDGREIVDDIYYGTNVRVSTGLYLRYLDLQARLQQLTLQLYGAYSNALCNNGACSNMSKQDIMMRDYLWMTLNAIKYAFDTCDPMTALKLLTNTQTCSNGKMYGSSQCGCYNARR